MDAPTRFRLACRELGTCLGVRVQVQCHRPVPTAAEDTAAGEKEKGEKDEKAYWDCFVEKMEMTWAPGLEKEPPAVKLKLQSITMAMYAAALVPGGKLRVPLRRPGGMDIVIC